MIHRLTLGTATAVALAACDANQVLAPDTSPVASQRGTSFSYQPTDLGTLGGSFSEAYNLNDRGMAVGVSTTASGQNRAFVWIPEGTGGTMHDLGTLGDWEHSAAYAINNHGDIAGQVWNAEGTLALPVRWNRLPSGGYAIEALTHLGGHKGGGFSINNRGDVAGADCLPGLKSHILIWYKKGNYRNLGNMGGVAAGANDINDAGELAVVHYQILDHPEYAVAYVWSKQRGFRPIGSLGGTGLEDQTAVWALNNHGEAVGISATSQGASHAFFWSEGGGIEDLGTLGGDYAVAFDINGGGEVVGASLTGDGLLRGFLWSRGQGMREIGPLVEGGWSSADATNGPGLIVGGSDTPDGEFHAVLWTPRAEGAAIHAAAASNQPGFKAAKAPVRGQPKVRISPRERVRPLFGQ